MPPEDELELLDDELLDEEPDELLELLLEEEPELVAGEMLEPEPPPPPQAASAKVRKAAPKAAWCKPDFMKSPMILPGGLRCPSGYNLSGKCATDEVGGDHSTRKTPPNRHRRQLTVT